MSSEQALLARRWWREDTLRGTGALDTPLRAPARLIRELDEHELLMDLDFLRVHAEKLVATLAREFRPVPDRHGMLRDRWGIYWLDELPQRSEPLSWMCATPLYRALWTSWQARQEIV